jgi:hypothetical protein
MGRLGYFILLALLMVGSAYVFWPEPAEHVDPPLWTGEIPAKYQVIAGGLTQHVDGQLVRINDVERPLDTNRHSELWSYLTVLTVNERAVTRVGEEQLASYGIDGSHEVSGSNLRLRWGGKGKEFFVWEGITGRLMPCEADISKRLDALTKRLDQTSLINIFTVRGIGIDTLRLRLDTSGWRDEAQAERPNFNRRVNQLFALLETLRLNDFVRRDPSSVVVPLHVLRLTQDMAAADAADVQVRLWTLPDGGLIQVGALPAQHVDAQTLAHWSEVIGRFRSDYLFNLETEFAMRPLGEIRVFDHGKLRFRLQKHGLNDVAEGRSQWDVVWPGGREPASENAASAIALALDELEVREPRRRQPNEDVPAQARRITFVFKVDQKTFEIAIDGNRVFSSTHVATAVTLPPLLADLSPDDMLDNTLTLRGAERVVKVQRQWHRGPQAGRSEVVAVAAGTGGTSGNWQQTWPKDTVGAAMSPMAVDRLARALCTARSRSVRLPTLADRAAVANADFELDVRFAQAQVRLSNDHTRLADTTDQDLGFAFVPEGDRWRAIDKETGISHVVDAELVDLLQAPLTDDVIMPLVPSLVSRIEITGPTGRFALMRQEDTWQVQALDAVGRAIGDSMAADAVEVRRYLRSLTALRSQRSDPDAGPLTPEQVAGSVLCVFPGSSDEKARIVLSLGHRVGQQMPVVVESVSGVRNVPRGRSYVASDQRDLLLLPMGRFLRAPAAKTGAAP